MILITMLPSFFFLAAGIAAATAASKSSCVGTISSLNDVSSAVECTTVNINAFTVPAGQTFELNLLDGTTVNVLGEIQFGNVSWAGPLFQVKGNDITFNGNNQKWDGGGPFYWDGQGSGGGVTKPRPMMHILISGTLNDVHVVNSPAQSFSIGNSGPITISGVTVDDSQGNYANSNSGGLPAGHNTDGFDVGGSNVIIQNSKVFNQDDCVAIGKGTNITVTGNYCSGGHGISIGSISSNVVVSDITISGNNVVDSLFAFRIKTDKSAKKSSVSNVTYTANTASNCTDYGVLITQSYPSNFGTPGNGVTISNINFNPGTTALLAQNDAYMAAVNCGSGSCTGIWDWSQLQTSGGKVGSFVNCDSVITGYDY
ncbi:pectin lyase fold/virulence factor [Suillus paluster]|uniref:pectin lyase fold/virulence factor n=1 Tax=Suillus paluster TaxID=48578 RepID=UPI001B86A4B8|nr:pectin lyase fold/virulence factor [Suillus paluster]KAG1728385.1 pectin lyase fold/virulence factor [Suillus paluster]